MILAHCQAGGHTGRRSIADRAVPPLLFPQDLRSLVVRHTGHVGVGLGMRILSNGSRFGSMPGPNALRPPAIQRGPVHAGVGQLSKVERGPRKAIAACCPDEYWLRRLSRICP